jgi:hypothetical protein
MERRANSRWIRRVEVDGAQSKLTLDTTSGSPTFGQYLPQVEVSA